MPELEFPLGGETEDTFSYFTEEALLSIIDGLLPNWYLEPLKDPGPGYEVLQAFAKALERVSLAINRSEQASYITTSHGGTRATGTVEFYRSSLTTGAFTVRKNTVVRCSKSRRSFRVVSDVSFGALDLVKSASVESVGFGAEYNVPGPFLTADGTQLPGEIDTVVLPLLSPLFAEPALAVRQVSDMSGGQAAVLDQLGNDRNLPRFPAEGDAAYKARIRALPDTVSPDAITRTLDSIFIPLGLEYQFIETWQNEYQTCWDCPEASIVHPIMGTVDPTCFWYDDTRVDPFRGRWMSNADCPSGIVVVVPNLTSWSMRGLAWDDTTALTAAAFTTTLGHRATTAYDGPDLDTDGVFFAGAWDGDDAYKDLFYKRLWDLLRQIKGAGEHVAIELQGE